MPDGKVMQLWGMSELQAGAFSRPSIRMSARMTNAGRASPGTELRVVDDGAPLPPARRANCRCAAARYLPAISAMPRRPPTPSPPTAGSAPAISRA